MASSRQIVRPERILVPLTLTAVDAVTEAKLPVVEQHARAFGAEVVLLHVLEGSFVTASGAPPPGEGLVPSDEAHARVHLDAVAARVRRAGIHALPVVRAGHVASVVRDTAREQSVRLIVVGRAPRQGLARFIPGLSGLPGFGGTAGRPDHADEIARMAPCPVLVVQSTGTTGYDRSGESDGGAQGAVDAEEHAGRRAAGARAGRRRALRRFDDDASQWGVIAPNVLGTRTVEGSRIVGTVPALDLGADFRPVRRSVSEAARHRGTLKMMAETPERLPPVGLYKLGYGYYVFSGHAQVAAARELGQTWLDATVTEYAPLEDAQAQRVLAERALFEREAGVTEIGAARPETYERLSALVDEFAVTLQAESGGTAIDRRTAAARWKTGVFRPIQRRLRELRLNQYFPGERSADIVIRIADHRAAESARRGRELYWEEAVATFAAACKDMGSLEWPA